MEAPIHNAHLMNARQIVRENPHVRTAVITVLQYEAEAALSKMRNCDREDLPAARAEWRAYERAIEQITGGA